MFRPMTLEQKQRAQARREAALLRATELLAVMNFTYESLKRMDGEDLVVHPSEQLLDLIIRVADWLLESPIMEEE